MKITGIVVSPRRLGNSDILVKSALKAVQGAGLEVRILRLSDFDIKYCQACEKCVTDKGTPCPIRDDTEFIFRVIRQSDGLLIGCPIYVHGIPAILKALIDRMRPYVENGTGRTRKFASFIFTHTLDSDFEYSYALPHLLFFSFYLSFSLSGILSVSAGPPGECLLIDDNIRNARILADRLCQDLGVGKQAKIETDSNKECTICPVCGNRTFQVVGDAVVCPVCREEGTFSDHHVAWRNTSEFKNLKDLMDNRFQVIAESHSNFRQNIRELIEKRVEYRDDRIGIPIIKRDAPL